MKEVVVSNPRESCALSLVIPVLNEEEGIEITINEIQSVLKNLPIVSEVVVVDDGSTDNTLKVLKRLAGRYDNLRCIELSRNFGQTAALAAGIDVARGEVIITMDGDGQHDPSFIPIFLEKLSDEVDIVSGCRTDRSDDYLKRKLPSFLANKIAAFISGLKLADFGSTYKAYRSKVVKNVELFGEMHRFIPILGHQMGARILEIPISIRERKFGHSHYNLKRVFAVIGDLCFLYFYLHYLRRPMRGFGKLFVIFFAFGFSIAFCLMFSWLLGFIVTVRDHSAMLLFAVFLMIVGIQFFVAGIITELLARMYFRSGNQRIYTIRREVTGTNVRN